MKMGNKIGIVGSSLMLVGFLFPEPLDPLGENAGLHVVGSVIALIGIGLILAAAWKGPRWWLGVFFALLIAVGLVLILVEHQH